MLTSQEEVVKLPLLSPY